MAVNTDNLLNTLNLLDKEMLDNCVRHNAPQYYKKFQKEKEKVLNALIDMCKVGKQIMGVFIEEDMKIISEQPYLTVQNNKAIQLSADEDFDWLDGDDMFLDVNDDDDFDSF